MNLIDILIQVNESLGNMFIQVKYYFITHFNYLNKILYIYIYIYRV